MSRQEVERLLVDVKNDTTLRSSLQQHTDDKQEWLRQARAAGYDITAEDVREPSGELSDEDLEKVAGGWSIGCDTNTINPTIMCSAVSDSL